MRLIKIHKDVVKATEELPDLLEAYSKLSEAPDYPIPGENFKKTCREDKQKIHHLLALLTKAKKVLEETSPIKENWQPLEEPRLAFRKKLGFKYPQRRQGPLVEAYYKPPEMKLKPWGDICVKALKDLGGEGTITDMISIMFPRGLSDKMDSTKLRMKIAGGLISRGEIVRVGKAKYKLQYHGITV